MRADEILEKINDYIDQHVSDVRGSIHQDPYKSDFFQLCLDAHLKGHFKPSSPACLTGDAMRGSFHERWSALEPEFQEKKFDLLEQVISMWDEWSYALNKVNYE
ncbi:MAG: hypothetical protein ABII18_02270 [bacterium]